MPHGVYLLLLPFIAGMAGKTIIQQLVRVFEVKRLTTSRLYDIRRHQLHHDYVAASVQSRYIHREP